MPSDKKNLIIKNGVVFTPDFTFKKADVFISDGKFSAADKFNSDFEELRADGLYVLPGLIDIHTHGAKGNDFCSSGEKGLRKIAEYELSVGVTSFCPTSMTLPENILSGIFSNAADIKTDSKYSQIVGINMEGPFLSYEKKGAQNEKYLKNPDFEMFKRLFDSSKSLIKLVTVAPELDNSYDFIKKASDYSHISLGHTSCSYEEAAKAFRSGADHVTHLFNAMNPFLHRSPGVLGASFDDDSVFVELISDGVHVDPSAVRAVFKLFGDDRVVLISDSMEGAGMDDGQYELGGKKVTKTGSKAVLSDGTIAGSVSNLFECMKKAVSFGIPLEYAVKAATYNPAKSIGIENAVGSVSPGLKADAVLTDKNLNIVKVIHY